MAIDNESFTSDEESGKPSHLRRSVPEKLRNYSPRNLVGAMKPSLGFLFEQLDKDLEVFTKTNETCFLTLFGSK